MKKTLIILAIVVVLIGWFVISTLNGLIPMDETCKANWSQVLNQYQRRSDLIPNLVATVKGYATHEQETLTQVIEARAKATQTTLSPEMLTDEKAMNAFMQNQGALSSALNRLMVVVEKYPELKANENFMALQSQLEGTENRITVARRDYIEAVKVFNTRIRTIPTKWIVAIFSDMEKKAAFDIEESKKAVPTVDFSK
jgi:LemA protein